MGDRNSQAEIQERPLRISWFKGSMQRLQKKNDLICVLFVKLLERIYWLRSKGLVGHLRKFNKKIIITIIKLAFKAFFSHFVHPELLLTFDPLAFDSKKAWYKFWVKLISWFNVAILFSYSTSFSLFMISIFLLSACNLLS